MATLDELFAEAGLSAPQRTNRGRTVTTPGSYEAPVEGIQDYGAFQRGFTAGITPGLIKKKKIDIRVDAAAKQFDALKLNELIETSDTDPVEFKKNAALRGQTLNLLKGELRSDFLKAARNNDTQSMNNILGQLSNLSEGIGNFNNFLTESQKTDQYDMEASNYRIGDNTYTDADGNVKPLTFNQLAEVNNTNPRALSYVQKKDEYGAVDTFLTVKNSKYGSFEVNISDLNAAQIQNKLALNADYGTETASHIKNNPIVDQNTTGFIGPNKTSSYTTTEVINGKNVRVTISGKKITEKTDDLNRNNARAFASKSIGEDDFNELMPSYLNKTLKRTDVFSNQEDKDNYKAMLSALQTKQGMINYANNNGLSLDQAKQAVKDNVNSVIQKSLENEYLKRTGSYEWNGEEYVPAVLDRKRSVSEAPVEEDDKDTGPTTVTSFMEDIFSKFNAATSGASQVLKDSPIDGILEGNDAQNTLTLLRGKKYNGKLITDVKYTKVGEKPNGEPDLRLQVFTQTGDDEIPQKSLVNITDAGSRREFLENIARSKFGSGTTVSKEIAEAYTNIQTTRSEVQGVFGIYSDRLRKTLETGQWDDNIPAKYKAAFDAEMDRKAAQDFDDN
tara:strand:- start:171 stop:2021 length:1851 start_codon:yes stop_codon:yes gene_type:complete